MVTPGARQKIRAGAEGVEQSINALMPPVLGAEQVESGSTGYTNGKQDTTRQNDADNIDETNTEASPLLQNGSSGFSSSTKPSPYLGNITRTRFWLIFSQLMICLLISCFDMTIMASSHPVITSYFHASHLASWLSTAPMVTMTVMQPLAGRVSDAVGRKPLFIGGMIVFTVATVWCSLATSIESFILARALLGFGGGTAMSLSAIILSDLVKIEYRGSYQAYANLVYGVGSSMGAALGGFMAEHLGWRWEFGVQVPPLVISITVAYMTIPGDLGLRSSRKSLRQTIRDFDSLGAVILTVFITFMILGLNLGGNELPWSHPFIITALALCAVSGPLFILAEKRAQLPVMPLKLLVTTPRANIVYTNFLCAILSNAILFNMPLYFQAVMLTSATSSGLRLVLPTVITSLSGAATGFAINYSGRIKWPVTTGPLLYIIGLICLSLLRRHLPDIIYHLVLVPTFIGQGMQMPGTFMALLGSSTQEEQAVVTAILTLWRSMGMVLGVALSSVAVQNGLVHYLGKYVVGDEAEKYIRLARRDVASVRNMPEPYREQVVTSYAAALRLTFICGVAMAVVAALIIIPARIKRLPARK